MWWKILIVVFGTICGFLIATAIWGNLNRGGADTVDIALALHSPSYWFMIAAVLLAAAWLLKHWLS